MGQNNVVPQDHSSTIEKIVAHGDLSNLSPKQRSEYYVEVCESLGLNPLTRPFEYIRLNGRLVLYARKDATDQLRNLHNVSISITNRQRIGEIYLITAKARLPNGREDEATGALPLHGLDANDLANAFMKAETKAKRRVTLSICGLGMLDESELATVDGATAFTPTDNNSSDQKHVLQEWSHRPAEKTQPVEKEAVRPPVQAQVDLASAPENQRAEDFVVRCGKKYKGHRIGDIPKKELNEYLDWLKDYTAKRRIPLTGDFLEFYRAAKAYLNENEENASASETISGAKAAQANSTEEQKDRKAKVNG